MSTQTRFSYQVPENGTIPAQGRRFLRVWDKSPVNTELVVSATPGKLGLIKKVVVVFSGNASLNVTVETVSGLGSDYDHTSQVLPVTNDSEIGWTPSQEHVVHPDDTVKVTVPAAGLNVTAAVLLELEIYP